MPSKFLAHLKTLLALTATQTDAFLLHFLRLLQTRNGPSSLLLTLQYALTLLHSQLTRILTNRYERLALSIASKASKTMLPGEALVATIEAPHLTLTSWCAGVDAARETVHDVRAFLRLVGLVEVYGKARKLYADGRRDPGVKVLEWAKLGARVGWQGAENLAFLVKRGVFRGPKWEAREKGLWQWSWRFWAAELVLEGLRLLRVRGMKFNEEFGAEGVQVQSRELEERWKRDVYSTIGWIPATMHFGFGEEEMSVGSEGWTGLGGMIPGVIGLKEAWKETA